MDALPQGTTVSSIVPISVSLSSSSNENGVADPKEISMLATLELTEVPSDHGCGTVGTARPETGRLKMMLPVRKPAKSDEISFP